MPDRGKPMKSDQTCLFCKIKTGQIPSIKVFENDNILAFNDINPLANTHILFIHKNHTKDINDLMKNNSTDLTDLFMGISQYTSQENNNLESFRLVTNIGKEAGQSVFHTHFHLLSGEQLGKFGR